MKASMMFLLLSVTSLLLVSCKHENQFENPYAKENFKRHILKMQNKILCEIVIPQEAGPVVAFAGEELRKFMSRSFGADVPLVETPTNGKISIILGNNRFIKGIGIDVDKLPRDGFVIRSSGDNLFIAGKDNMKTQPAKVMDKGYWANMFERGTLFGVYDFLERFLGVRFYFPGDIGTIVPKLDYLALPELNISEAPDYTTRKYTTYDGETPKGLTGKASWKFKTLNNYRLRMETRMIPNCHGLARLGYLKRFGESNPEYFAMLSGGKRHNNPALSHPGQLCYNSAVREEIYQDAKAFLSGKPASSRGVQTKYGVTWDPSGFQPGYFNIMPQDGFYSCRCPVCKPIYEKGNEAISEFIWDFVCESAERLTKEGIPGYVTMMAYSPYRSVPKRDISENILVMLAERGPWSLHFPAQYERDEAEIKAWVDKMGKKIWLWNYANKFGKLEMPGVPDITPRAIGEYYKLQKPYIFGAYMESETDKFIYHYLNYYVFSKVCWDNDLNLDDLLAEHYLKMFGGAAKVMEDIYGRFSKNWFKIIGKPIDTPLGPSCVPVSEYELWEIIYPMKEINHFEQLFKDAEKLATGDELKRVRFMQKHLLGPLKKQRLTYLANKKEIEDLTFYVKSLPGTEKINIDGMLDEDMWNKSSKIFLRPLISKKHKGTKGVRTIVRALRNQDNLYFAFECEEPEMNSLLASKREFDNQGIWRDSSVELFLNPSGDQKKYYQLLINSQGSVSDLSGQKIGASQKHDWNWNSGAKVAVKRNADSWIVEVAVPIKNLPDFREKGFPVNFNRNRILTKVDNDIITLFTWSPFIKNGFHDLPNFGSVIFEQREDKNIIKNSDFIGKVNGRFFDGWHAPQAKTLKNGEKWSLVTDSFIKGGSSVKLECPKRGSILVGQYLPGLKANTKYLLTFYLKTKNIVPFGKGAGVCVNIWDDKNRWFPANYYTGTMPWTKQGFVLTTGPATNQKYNSYIRLRILNASGSVWFDDIRLREVKK